MSERDDLEELLQMAHERRLQALEHELDRRMSRRWRAPERQFGRGILKPVLALASVALAFLGAWLYDLSQSWEASSIVLRDARYEHPQLVLKESGDPVRLTQQLAGVPEQEPALRLVEPGLGTGVFRAPTEMLALEGLHDSKGNLFVIVGSKIVKIAPDKGNFFVIEGPQIIKIAPDEESSVIAENLDDPRSLAFDAEGNLLVVESGRGRILRVEAIAGEVKAGSPISVFAEGFASSARESEDIEAMREHRPERLDMGRRQEEHIEPVYVTVNKSGEIFVGGRAENGEAVVYKIARKSFKWWRFYCLYRC